MTWNITSSELRARFIEAGIITPGDSAPIWSTTRIQPWHQAPAPRPCLAIDGRAARIITAEVREREERQRDLDARAEREGFGASRGTLGLGGR